MNCDAWHAIKVLVPIINGKPGSGVVFPKEVMFDLNGMGTAWEKEMWGPFLTWGITWEEPEAGPSIAPLHHAPSVWLSQQSGRKPGAVGGQGQTKQAMIWFLSLS